MSAASNAPAAQPQVLEPTAAAKPNAAPASPAPNAQPPSANAAPAVGMPASAATTTTAADGSKPDGTKPLVDYAVHVKAPAVTKETEEKLRQLRDELAKEKVYSQNAAMRYYCDPQMLHRYLRARGGNVQKAKEMLLASLEWRKEMRPELIRATDMATEGRTGKVIVCHHLDRHGRPIMCMDGSKENTKNAVDQLRFVAWSLHRTWMKMQNGVEKYVLFINLSNYSFFNSPPIRTTLETVKTLVSRYPEHMGHCIMWQAPRLFSALWAMATPIIDAHMLSKVLFVQGDTGPGSKNDKILREIVGDNWKTMLHVEGKEFEKTCPPGFDHASFWPQVLAEDKIVGAKYTEFEAQWAKEDGGRPLRDSSNVGITPAEMVAREKEKEEAAKKAAAAAASAAPKPPAAAADGKSPAPSSPQPVGAPAAAGSPGAAAGAGAAAPLNSQAVVVTPPAAAAGAGSSAGVAKAGGSPSKPAAIDTSKATLEVSPLPAPPMPNTPIVIPAEALGYTPTAPLRALPGGSQTPPTSQSGK